eukprot:CFRG5343T1
MANAVLIHNVSHSDLLLSLQCDEKEWAAQHKMGSETVGVERGLMGRPQYSMFQPVTDKLLKGVLRSDAAVVLATEHISNNSRQFVESNVDVVKEIMKMADGTVRCVPIGLQLLGEPIHVDWKNYHLRPSVNKDALKDRKDVRVFAMYFPQIALSIPLWMERCKGAHKTIFLVCGEGHSRNPAHGSYENSTLGTARLVEVFLQCMYPKAGLSVEIIYSEAEIFKVRDNVEFFLKELHPRLYSIRRRMANMYDEAWPDRFRVTVSLSDGPPARLNALMASLRQFRSDVAHMWQPKVFFHFGTLSEEDVEYHSFDLVDAQPPIGVGNPALSPAVKDLVDKVLEYKERFLRTTESGDSELKEFWLRKTRKPVLSVLRYTKLGEQPQYVYGMNIEVSMPTGSLCSERNAIGTAIASDPSLKRKDFDMIAILSLPSPDFDVTAHTLEHTDEHLTQNSTLKDTLDEMNKLCLDCDKEEGLADSNAIAANSHDFYSDCPEPLRRLNSEVLMTNDSHWEWPHEKRKTELNPLGPCGSCMEWLKKIAEVNPDMKIVTFLDSSCQRVFVKNVIM